MKIERHYVKQESLEDFAETHGFVLVINERTHASLGMRFYCAFKNVEVMDGGALISEYGNGNNEKEAMLDYMRRISGKTIVHDAFTPNRKEISVPYLSSLRGEYAAA